ncbi:MAG: DNA helicase UvrD, partial [Nanoarchaeota archaeon]
CSPSETKKLGGKCPKCGKGLTIGVDYRVEEIAKEKSGYKPENARVFYELIPLHELIALALGTRMESAKSWEIYNLIIERFGNELNVLMKVSREEMLRNKINEKLVEIILLGREGKLKVKPGYDGEYGVVLMPEEQEKLF